MSHTNESHSVNNSRHLTLAGTLLISSTVLYNTYRKWNSQPKKNKNETKEEDDSTINHFISNERYSSLSKSIYVQPLTMYFEQNGKTRRWDLLESFNVVCGIIYDIKKESFLFVKQFRPAVYYSHKKSGTLNKLAKKYPNEQIGCTYELCAGLMDKEKLNAKQTMQEEFLEECGYDIPLDKILKIASYRSATGVMGNLTHVYMAFVDDSMIVNEGGGDEMENIELVWVPLNESQIFMMDEDKDMPPGLKFAIFWFYQQFPELCKNVKDSVSKESQMQLKQIKNDIMSYVNTK